MPDWKIPEWRKEIYETLNLKHPIGSEFDKGFNAAISITRSEGLLSTPAERDTDEKRINELEAEAKQLRGHVPKEHWPSIYKEADND